jgi:hypothetical protein
MENLRIVSAVTEICGKQYQYRVGVIQHEEMNNFDVAYKAHCIVDAYQENWGDGVMDKVWGDGVLCAPTKRETEEGVQNVRAVENCELGYIILV